MTRIIYTKEMQAALFPDPTRGPGMHVLDFFSGSDTPVFVLVLENGEVMKERGYRAKKGRNTFSLNLASFKPGKYALRILGTDCVSDTSFVIS